MQTFQAIVSTFESARDCECWYLGNARYDLMRAVGNACRDNWPAFVRMSERWYHKAIREGTITEY